MPRIDPVKLLECLSVLLSPTGGIKSRGEVERLANLMTKFSKKLVSKCIYIQILKCTDTEILRLFMGSGGWLLVHVWLTESIVAKNWPLVRELLELLLLCPVDIERLKTNNCPKLVKELSKDGNHFAIRALASKLVEQWLKTVKGEQVIPIQLTEISQIISESEHNSITINNSTTEKNEEHLDLPEKENVVSKEIDSPADSSNVVVSDINVSKEVDETKEREENETLPVLKITVKDGKQILSQVDETDSKLIEGSPNSEKYNNNKHKSKNKEKSNDNKNSSRSSSSKYSKSHSSSSKNKSSSSSSSSSHKSSSSRHSSRDKSSDKDKSSSHSSKPKSESSSTKYNVKINSSSSKSKEDRNKHTSSDKDKNKEKDKIKSEKNRDSQKSTNENIQKKDTEKLEIPSIQKLGKIPKLSDIKKEKPSISIEVRKPDEPKPKTVKTFHSKFRKHGLEEEIKPPPSRAAILSKKVTPVLPPTIPIPKRPSPVHNETPPEKKPKTIEIQEKPGSIKLIPPKPKPMMLLESDMFMDALNASATNKKEPKKRKRRTSGSKDGNAPGDGSPPSTPTTITSPTNESKSVPPRFYQDTLETEESKEKLSERMSEANENVDNISDKEHVDQMESEEPHTLTINGLKGVLCYHKKKGPKKSIKWKPDSELEEIQYFELDETERVNVTKPFTDMKYLERIHEREAFQKGRNLSNDDVMEEKTTWRPLIPIDLEGQTQVEYGKNSKEKEIQAIRQKGTLQPLYFHKSMIPDSPLEADPETHPYTEPTIIPLEDVTGNQDNISDFRNMPWPEPKGNAPPASSTMNIQPMFPPNITQFPNNFPNAQFPGVPGFQGPNMVPSDWQNGAPPSLLPPMPSQLPPGMPPGSIPPGIIMPPDNMMMGPEMFAAPNAMFPGPPDGFNMQPNMFPVDFNMPGGPQGLPGPDGFAGQGNFRGAMRGRGSSGHWRGKNAGNWDGGPQRGRGAHSRGGRKSVCIYFQRKGSCRQGDNCSFLHPGVNCPY